MPTKAELDQATEKAAVDALLSKEIKDLRETVNDLKEDRDKFLRWGVIVLGGAVVGLASLIFDLIVGKHT